MLNLHPPFRFAEEASGQAVEAVEDDRVVARLAGEVRGDAWHVIRLAVDPERLDDLAPRLLAVADALAADEGLGAVTLDPGGFAPALMTLLDREGFRPADAAGEGRRLLSRPVIPQG